MYLYHNRIKNRIKSGEMIYHYFEKIIQELERLL